MRHALLLFLALFISIPTLAEEAPRVGRRAAARYFESDSDRAPSSDSRPPSSGENILMIHAGAFTESTAYKWAGEEKRTGIGKAIYGLTYLYDRWNSIDTNIRADFTEFKLGDERATKLSLLALWTFPMAESRFPLYFGFGVGPGIFFTQIEGESNLSLDYQLIAGVRFLDIIENFGVTAEYGLKNHLHLLSDGQYNSTALTVGVVFTF